MIHVLQVAFMQYRVNGQYIMEGLASSFLFTLGGLGFVILDQTNKPTTPRLNRILLLSIAFVCILVSFFMCRVFMRMKLPWVDICLSYLFSLMTYSCVNNCAMQWETVTKVASDSFKFLDTAWYHIGLNTGAASTLQPPEKIDDDSFWFLASCHSGCHFW